MVDDSTDEQSMPDEDPCNHELTALHPCSFRPFRDAHPHCRRMLAETARQTIVSSINVLF